MTLHAPVLDRGDGDVKDLVIASVEAIPLSANFRDLYGDAVPDWLVHPAASHRTLERTGQYSTLVRVRTASGLEGIGECYGLPNPAITALIFNEVIAPLVVGESAWSTDFIWTRLFSALSGGGHLRGFYLEAISGLDIALWDLKGKAAEQPIYELIGGPHRTQIPVYASPVPMLPDPAASAEAALAFVDSGYHALKLKLGRGAVTDLAHATAVREAVGDDVQVLVDLNCAYTSDVAMRVGLGLGELGITWFEEPVAVDDVAGYVRLRESLPLSLVNGETLFTRYDFREFFIAGAVDIVMPNVARAGGITECLKIAAMASAFHVDIAPHGVGSAIGVAAALHLSAAVSNFRIYEYNRLPNPLRDAMATAPFVLDDGCLSVPSGPGLGIELDWDRVAEYTAK